VCQSEFREAIEEWITEGAPYLRIEERTGVERRSIANHAKKHMDMARSAISDELMDEARALAQDVETKGTITDRGILRVMASKGFKDIINGVTTVEPKDMIAIIKLLNELNSNVANTRAEENEIALRTFVRAIENVCDKDTIVAIVAEAERIKDLDDISFQMEGIIIRQEPPGGERKELLEMNPDGTIG
jgi:E3 ubiquitin-protein ligase DOA10